MKLRILYILFISVGLMRGAATPSAQALKKTVGAHFSPRQLDRLQSLCDELVAADTETRILVCQHLSTILNNELEHVKEKIERIDKEGKQVSRGTFYLKFILVHQLKHITTYLKSLTENESWLTTASRTLRDWYRHSITFIQKLRTSSYTDPTTQLIHECMWYIGLERKKILSDYETLVSFIVNINKYPLPEPLNFWKNQTLQQRLKKRIKNMGPEVMVQFIEGVAQLVMDFAVQGVVMGGVSMAWQWVDETRAELFDSLNQEIEEITDEYSQFQQQQVEDQQAAASAIISTFTTAQQNLSEQYAATNELLSAQIAYLNKSINLAQPAQRFVVDQINFDTLFERSPMYTPNNGYPWFNIYQAGDWEFDNQTNSFWQYRMVPFGTPFWQDGTQDPATNSIFCEYITDKTTYTIEVEMTLISAEYPFFAGIIFNRSRWISGDPERLWGYRLVGLYGTEITPTDTTTRSVSLAFAEQNITFPETEDGQETITSPLEIITTQPQQQPFTLPETVVQKLEADPQKFTITISTSATSVTYTLSQNNTELFTATIPGLNPYFFVYHGIGFIASGCQAQFKLNKPENLVYTQSERDDFDATISEAIS